MFYSKLDSLDKRDLYINYMHHAAFRCKCTETKISMTFGDMKVLGCIVLNAARVLLKGQRLA